MFAVVQRRDERRRGAPEVIVQQVAMGVMILAVTERGFDNADDDFVDRSTVLVTTTLQVHGSGHRLVRPLLHLQSRYAAGKGATPFL